VRTNRLKFFAGFLLTIIGSLLYLYYSYYSSTYSHYVSLLPAGYSILLVLGTILLGSYITENWRTKLILIIIIIVSFLVFVAIPIAFYWSPLFHSTGNVVVFGSDYLPALLPAILAILLLVGIVISLITNSNR